MAKRKKAKGDPIGGMGIGPPSSEEQRRFAAEQVAETVIRTDPAIKKKKNEIVDAVMAASAKAMRKS